MAVYATVAANPDNAANHRLPASALQLHVDAWWYAVFGDHGPSTSAVKSPRPSRAWTRHIAQAHDRAGGQDGQHAVWRSTGTPRPRRSDRDSERHSLQRASGGSEFEGADQ